MNRITISTTISEPDLIFIKEKGFKISSVLEKAIQDLKNQVDNPFLIKNERAKREAWQRNFEKLKEIFIEENGEDKFFNLWQKNV